MPRNQGNELTLADVRRYKQFVELYYESKSGPQTVFPSCDKECFNTI